MTQEVEAGASPAPEGLPAVAAPWAPVRTRRSDAQAGRAARRRGGRLGAFVTGVLLLALLAGDLWVAYRLPVDESTCTDRLCGPGLGVAGASLGVGLLAVVVWLVGDRRRDRGRGLGVCWAAVVLAALPVAFWGSGLRWW